MPSKINCCIAFESASSACCLLKSIAIILQYFLKYCNLANDQLCYYMSLIYF